MNYDDRLIIQECLSKGMSFKATAACIGKDQTTVSKEVKKRLVINPSSTKHFNKDGDLVATPICSRLLKAPFCCNACEKRRTRCAYDKHYYYAKQAQLEYETLLSESREGIPLNKEQFYEMDGVITDGINAGQHLYHIMTTHNLGVSKSTVYRHLKRGYLSVSPVDFPRVVKFKQRHKRQEQYIPKALKLGRTYEDFQRLLQDGDLSSWVEMDTVIGRLGGKVILTLHFTFCNFMAGHLLPDKSAASVRAAFLHLKKRFTDNGLHLGSLSPYILTDNGGEFSDIFAIENDMDGNKEISLFFCDPMQSSQKPFIEKNHTLFRDIVPKGTSFDGFTQSNVDLIFSHVNGVKRKLFSGRAPYELFTFAHGAEVASLFGVERVRPEDVIQSPELLKIMNR
jgi:IS30 family transposase